MIRFPAISHNTPLLPTLPERPEPAPKQSGDRLTLGAELHESAQTENPSYLKALTENLSRPESPKSGKNAGRLRRAQNFRMELKKRRELKDPPGLKKLLETRKDIKRSDLQGLTRWSSDHFSLLMDNPLLRPADLKDVDREQLAVIRARPELHPQELPNMDRQLAAVLGPMLGQRGAGQYLPLIRDNCFELLTKRGDLRPESIVDLMRRMATAAAGQGNKGEGPDMFLKATETMVRRPDLTPEQLAKVAQDMSQRVFYDGHAGQTQEAFGRSMDLLQKQNGLNAERISEQMHDMDLEPARRAGPKRRARVLHKRLKRLEAA